MLTDHEFVRAWLEARASDVGVDPSSLSIVSVSALSRGVSRQTWSVVVEDIAGRRELAVRRDHEVGSVIPTSLRTEFDVYSALAGTAVPHAEALLWEDDPIWMPDGRPAYIRTMVEGGWRLPELEGDPATNASARIGLAREHIDKLAMVHGVDWRKKGFGRVLAVPPTPAAAAEFMIDDLLAQLTRHGSSPSIAAAEAVATMRSIAPSDLEELVLCKGTNGHGEEVWRNGRIVAMSDWELAAIGDPAYDFVQCQELLADIVVDGRHVWGMQHGLDYYRETTGRVITPERIDFYRKVMALVQHVYTQHSAQVVKRLSYPPLRFVWTATEVAFRNEIRLASAYTENLLTEAVA